MIKLWSLHFSRSVICFMSVKVCNSQNQYAQTELLVFGGIFNVIFCCVVKNLQLIFGSGFIHCWFWSFHVVLLTKAFFVFACILHGVFKEHSLWGLVTGYTQMPACQKYREWLPCCFLCAKRLTGWLTDCYGRLLVCILTDWITGVDLGSIHLSFSISKSELDGTLSEESEVQRRRTAGGMSVELEQLGGEEDEKGKTNEENKQVRDTIKYWESIIVLLGVITFWRQLWVVYSNRSSVIMGRVTTLKLTSVELNLLHDPSTSLYLIRSVFFEALLTPRSAEHRFSALINAHFLYLSLLWHHYVLGCQL